MQIRIFNAIIVLLNSLSVHAVNKQIDKISISQNILPFLCCYCWNSDFTETLKASLCFFDNIISLICQNKKTRHFTLYCASWNSACREILYETYQTIYQRFVLTRQNQSYDVLINCNAKPDRDTKRNK